MSTPDPTQSQVTPPAQGATAAKSYQPYVDAKWGLKNHWYPALFSHELEEGAFLAIHYTQKHSFPVSYLMWLPCL